MPLKIRKSHVVSDVQKHETLNVVNISSVLIYIFFISTNSLLRFKLGLLCQYCVIIGYDQIKLLVIVHPTRFSALKQTNDLSQSLERYMQRYHLNTTNVRMCDFHPQSSSEFVGTLRALE